MTIIKTIKLKPNQLKDATNTNVRTDHIYNPDPIREFKINLYDVDEAIKWHLENVVRFKITKVDGIINVPVIYASPEKWYSIQQFGYLRDSGDKLIVPLVALSRTGIDYRDDYRKNEVTKGEENRWIYEKKYSSKNKYTPFSTLNNVTPLKEYYSIDLPRYVTLTYTLICWTDFTQHLNELIEQLMYFNGTAFGNDLKFTTYVDAPSIEMSNNVGEDHYSRATFTLRVKAYILNPDDRTRPTIQKLVAPNKIVLNFHESDSLVDSFTTSTRARNTSIIAPGSVNNDIVVSIDTTVLTYLNTNSAKVAVYSSPNSAIVSNASFLQAPANLPETDKTSFTYFINGQNVSTLLVTSLTQSGNDVIVVFNTPALDYELEASDEIIIVGKWA